MQDIVKVVLAGILCVMWAVQFKSGKQEYGIYLSICFCLLLFGIILSKVLEVQTLFEEIKASVVPYQGYLSILWKIVGITYICELGAGICRDAGYQAVGAQLELFGKLAILISGVPILIAIIEQLETIT